MKDKLRELIDYIKRKKIDYADVRYVERRSESITVKDGRLEAFSRNEAEASESGSCMMVAGGLPPARFWGHLI